MKVSTLASPFSGVKRPRIAPVAGTGSPAMLCPPQTPSPLIADWLDRHRHRGSFVLHVIGIPVSIIGLLLLPIALPTASAATFGVAIGLFVAGFLFQFLGHALEGTEPGEVTLLKRRLGRRRPEVEPAPGGPREVQTG